MARNKITKYKLDSRCLVLYREGRTTQDIANILTEELDGVDSLSQRAVSRYLQPIRQEECQEMGKTVREYIKKNVESDLEILDEGQAFCVEEARNTDNNAKVRADFWLRGLKFVETKLRFALSDPQSGQMSSHPVDLDEFRNEINNLKESCDG